MSKSLHDDDHTKAIAIPWAFSENSQAKNYNPELCGNLMGKMLHGDEITLSQTTNLRLFQN